MYFGLCISLFFWVVYFIVFLGCVFHCFFVLSWSCFWVSIRNIEPTKELYWKVRVSLSSLMAESATRCMISLRAGIETEVSWICTYAWSVWWASGFSLCACLKPHGSSWERAQHDIIRWRFHGAEQAGLVEELRVPRPPQGTSIKSLYCRYEMVFGVSQEKVGGCW